MKSSYSEGSFFDLTSFYLKSISVALQEADLRKESDLRESRLDLNQDTMTVDQNFFDVLNARGSLMQDTDFCDCWYVYKSASVVDHDLIFKQELTLTRDRGLDLFIKKSYLCFLGRHIDRQGFLDYKNSIEAGGISYSDFIRLIISSTESNQQGGKFAVIGNGVETLQDRIAPKYIKINR